ncbi:hypothetical protein AV530_005361 [Patagioenas fasciata monilis]|uniref:Uncharacterized protein n=1 Tax=Patagioenas fasciata monilis TaxID=372326 RepID=A0A1V4JM92_PATFA|nr:hypothetical protein AV530_005361 [Patagioenas fasciata monilis]
MLNSFWKKVLLSNKGTASVQMLQWKIMGDIPNLVETEMISQCGLVMLYLQNIAKRGGIVKMLRGKGDK